MDTDILVTRPKLPPLDQLVAYLEEIWASRVITNGGPYHQSFESELEAFLAVKHVSLTSNATIGLLLALKAFNLTGEVITTPYSFVATAHSIVWNGLTPVFVDVSEQDFNIDASLLEAAITDKTTAILAVHCYGNPCNVEEIDRIASKYQLRVIYDAAHAFGVRCHCGSLFEHGDASVLSFHATKVFNTFEGGAVITREDKYKAKVDSLKNFGFEDEVTVNEVGINGKMSEFNAALGLLQLKLISNTIHERELITSTYTDLLSRNRNIEVRNHKTAQKQNFSYFPILVKDSYPGGRDALYHKLRNAGIYSRRYFFPLISNLPMYKNLPSANPRNLRVANYLSDHVLCLPLYDGLARSDIEKICRLVND